MGYTTDFQGTFTIDKPVSKKVYDLLKGLASTRRMKRDPKKLAKRLKLTKEEVVKKYGEDCELWVGDTENSGQKETNDVVDQNTPPRNQPSLWCQWAINDDKQTLVWDEGEKFYNYVEWVEYIIEYILAPNKYKLNGIVSWQGEDSQDRGEIHVEDNKVKIYEAYIKMVPQEQLANLHKVVNDYLTNPLKEIIDDKLNAM